MNALQIFVIKYKCKIEGILHKEIFSLRKVNDRCFSAIDVITGEECVYNRYQVIELLCKNTNTKIQNLEFFPEDCELLEKTLSSEKVIAEIPHSIKKKHGSEIIKGQRGAEKKRLYKRFYLEPLQEIYKGKLYELFGCKCYNCSKTGALDIDHHIPMALGGHLVPGNLVVLCKQCNDCKHDKHPVDFYSEIQLKNLRPLLDEEWKIFNFKFNWDLWNDNPYKYLTDIGIDADLAKEISENTNDPYYWRERIIKLRFWQNIDPEIINKIKSAQNGSKNEKAEPSRFAHRVTIGIDGIKSY